MAITYPPELPVSAHREEIRELIQNHQVLILAGETGSGKTTQLPKIMLELGLAQAGMIGHTQPRRIAARSVAQRIAEELNQPLGEDVGYQIRFDARASEQTRIKIMTDGILLSQLHQDPFLKQYQALIIDEAHERSLNIDVLLGYLKALLPRRPDLKLVITSATVDVERFSAHFNDAPVFQVSGRTYPVEFRYRPLQPEDELELADSPTIVPPASDFSDQDQSEAIGAAVSESLREGTGDILVFLPTERDIRETDRALTAAMERGSFGTRGRNLDILPLFSRLSAAEQQRIFRTGPRTRVVLSTNVAETSLTVPGIHTVIDTGLARISRYSSRSKVQRLPIEPISQAAATQRAGRCGRIGPGLCIRLYSEADYLSRPEHTEPEILRTSLATVILQLLALPLHRLGITDVTAFPFLDAPEAKQLRDAVTTLLEIGAVRTQDSAKDSAKNLRITRLGRRLVPIPLDVRFARMLLAAQERGCAREVAIITAALAIQDVRERPADRAAAADQAHARFQDADSDFIGILHLWDYLQGLREGLSHRGFNRECRKNFLHAQRSREWQDLVAQINRTLRLPQLEPKKSSKAAAARLSVKTSQLSRGKRDQIHQSLLTGLLSHVGMYQERRQGGRIQREYLGARGIRFQIFPGSALATTRPEWVVAAELVETGRLWGRQVARISPELVEPIAGHIVRTQYSEPHWSTRKASGQVYEKVLLYGLPLIADRVVPYARLDEAAARDMFISEALVAGKWQGRHKFLVHNHKLVAQAEALARRTRLPNPALEPEALAQFYSERIPQHVTSGAHFDTWWRQQRPKTSELLHMSRTDLLPRQVQEAEAAAFPRVATFGPVADVPVRYEMDQSSGQEQSHITLSIAQLRELAPEQLYTLAPVEQVDTLTALIRALPKPVRKQLVPAPDTARLLHAWLREHTQDTAPLPQRLSAAVMAIKQVDVAPQLWDETSLPMHTQPVFHVVNEAGEKIGSGQDIQALQQLVFQESTQEISQSEHPLRTTALSAWTSDDATLVLLPDHVEIPSSMGPPLTAFVGFEDHQHSVGVQLFPTGYERDVADLAGRCRLLQLAVPQLLRQLKALVQPREAIALTALPEGPSHTQTLTTLVQRAAYQVMTQQCVLAHTRNAEQWQQLLPEAKAQLVAATEQGLHSMARIAEVFSEITQHVSTSEIAYARSLLTPEALTQWPHFEDGALLRYLRAEQHRLTHSLTGPKATAAWQEYEQAHTLVQRIQHAYAHQGATRRTVNHDMRVWSLVELLAEFRVSLFAQHIGTAQKVSLVRIERAATKLQQDFL